MTEAIEAPHAEGFSLLGIITKLPSKLPNNTDSGLNIRLSNRARRIIEYLEHAEEIQDYQQIRLAMLAFLRHALPGITGEFITKTGKLKAEFRTKYCMAFVRPDIGLATFQYSDQSGQAGLHDVGFCGSVWVCPVCQERINRKKGKDLSRLLALNDKYFIVMAAYTISHHEGDNLDLILGSLSKAIDSMKSGGKWDRFVKKWGIVGSVWTLENTHGNNGHHPHRHELFVIDKEKIGKSGPDAKVLFETEFRAELFSLYHYQLNENGIDCDEKHGLVVTANRKDYGDYITKWGAVSELTRSVHKMASGGGRSMAEVLKGAMYGSSKDWSIYLEYIRAFKGRKQLHFSKGLRKLLELGAEQTDHKLAEQIDLPDDRRVVVVVSQMGLTYIHSKDLVGPVILFIKRTKGDSNLVIDYLARMGLQKFIVGGPGFKDDGQSTI